MFFTLQQDMKTSFFSRIKKKKKQTKKPPTIKMHIHLL